ncbi:MAG: ornithine carbamoyltransferase, partial [Candidatus Bathyarchaeia archaeon]
MRELRADMSLHGRDFLSMMEFSGHELMSLIQQAESIKTGKLEVGDKLKGKHLALIFQRPSTRTKISFEVAISHLGG